jgi:excisionase family DNA binding protein
MAAIAHLLLTDKSYTPAEVAERLGVSYITVLAWIRDGSLTGTIVSRNPASKRPRWRIAEADLEAFLVERHRAAVKPVPQARRPATNGASYV